MSLVDRQRIAAVEVLLGLGWIFDGKEWAVPVDRKTAMAAGWQRTAIIMALREKRMSFPQIGEVIGIDHTAVMYHVRKAQQAAETLLIR